MHVGSRRAVAVSVAAALSAFSTGAGASGFQLMEQNASGLGNAYAGQAAVAEDASTIYFNPAGLTRLRGRQAVVAAHAIKPSAEFNDRGTTPAVSTIAGAGPFPRNGTGGNGGDLALVPNTYFSWQVTPEIVAGVGVNVPFGLKTDYDPDWMGRFHARKSEAKSINVNPAVAVKVTDAISVGAGVNFQHFEATLTKAVNYSFLASAAGVPGVPLLTEGANKIEGDDRSWGWNVGVLIKAGPDTDIGVAYRSAIRHTLKGDVTYFDRPAAIQALLGVPAVFNQAGDGPISARVKLPASASVALKHRFRRGWMGPSGWEVLADVTWTQWSNLQSLDIVRSNGALLESTPFEWRDTWRFGLGFNYHTSDVWTYRFGVAYDQTPTSGTFRTPRIPDESRTWAAVGAQYRLSKAGAIDVGYAHIFVKDAHVSLSGPPAITPAQAAGRGSLVGTFDGQVDILSVQYRHSF